MSHLSKKGNKSVPSIAVFIGFHVVSSHVCVTGCVNCFLQGNSFHKSASELLIGDWCSSHYSASIFMDSPVVFEVSMSEGIFVRHLYEKENKSD